MSHRERGIALPTVLIAMLALTTLALAITVSSRNEVVVSGSQMRAMTTLQAADAGLNFSLQIPANFADPVSQPLMDLRPQGLPFDGTVKVDYEPPSRLPPPGVHISALKLVSYYFLLTAEGQVLSTSAEEPNSSTRLEMEAVKLGPTG